ncbi:gamma-glutamyltransferase [Acinetobacter baylyi]|uniref:gamma-glutamyltransferase n=1 Tax=Acinetobacter baylyi TaxID=202950 RepID=UPI00286AD119|nr:gamma-glutamyltransferase [Acinetobacter baylyi]
MIRLSLLSASLFLTVISNSTVYAEQSPSKYCNTASACLDPMLTNAAVTTPNYLATQAAVETLQKGGNAVDAAISAAATLAVVYPQMNTIGGDNFWLIYNAKTKQVRALNASGRAGENVSIDFYKSRGYDKIPRPWLFSCQHRARNRFRMGSSLSICIWLHDQQRFGLERFI